MSTEIPQRPANNELLARNMAYAEKPFQEMRLNAQRAGRSSTVAVLATQAFVAGEQAYWEYNLGWDASPVTRSIGVRVRPNDELAQRVAIEVAQELNHEPRPGAPSPYGRLLGDRTFQYDRFSEENVPFTHPVVTERVNMIMDMLGVAKNDIPEDITSIEDRKKARYVSAWKTNMGLDLIEVIEDDTVNLYVKRLEPVEEPVELWARNVKIKTS